MKRVTLHIQNPYDKRSIEVGDELTVGRTDASDVVIEDSGLSRKNTTIFRDGDLLLVADENSTNGTFVNGRKLSGPPEELHDGDEIKIGTDTRIRVEIEGEYSLPRFEQPPAEDRTTPMAQPADASLKPVGSGSGTSRSNRPPMVVIVAGLLTAAIIVFGLIAFLIFGLNEGPPSGNGTKPTPIISKTSRIPVRVIDPLGGEDDNDIDDIIASMENAEEEINAGNVSDITVGAGDAEEKDLNVTAAFLADRQKKALEPRNAETGIRPAGLDVPKELFGDGVIKQKAKLSEMKSSGYH
jgi:FHA domain-containing protein